MSERVNCDANVVLPKEICTAKHIDLSETLWLQVKSLQIADCVYRKERIHSNKKLVPQQARYYQVVLYCTTQRCRRRKKLLEGNK